MNKQKDGVTYTIKEWPTEERPRERFAKLGPAALSSAELLAILISTGSGGETAVDVAKKLLVRFSSLRDLSTRSLNEFKDIKGIGLTKAIKIQTALELGRRMTREQNVERFQIRSPKDVYEYSSPFLQDLKQEVFKILLLNSQNEIMRELTISQGSLTASIVHPREVFKPAILESAASVVLLHNHPSGNPTPSEDDKVVTKQLTEAGRLLGIDVHDHVIIGDNRYLSFAEAGLM